MAKRELFPELPDPADLRLLNDEEVQTLLDAHLEVAGKIAEKDEELLTGLSQKDILDGYQAGVDQIEKLREEQEARGVADQKFEESLGQLNARAGVKEADAPAEDAETDEAPSEEEAPAEVVAEAAEEATEPVVEATEVVEEAVAAEADLVLAAAPPLPEPMEVRKPPMVAQDHIPVVVKESRQEFSLIASAGIPDIERGSSLDDESLARAMFAMMGQQISFPQGFQDKAVVASANYFDMYPEDRQLLGNRALDWAKIRAARTMGVNAETGEEQLVASGGLCAPVTPYYGLWNEATAARPVRDALTGFAAVRGGIQVAEVPTIGDVTDGVGIKTAAQDAAGGTNAEKTCQVVACPDFNETQLDMIYHCVQFGNLNSRAWPEFVAQFNDLVMAAHARLAEVNLLNGIADASVDVDGSKIYGATSTVLNQVLYIVAALRSYYRLSSAARFRGLFPAWAREIIAADVVNTQFDRFGVAPGDVDGLLRRYGVEPTWYLDSATGEGQIFSNQTDGALRDFPTNLVYYVYPEGSFLFLDGGSLELGIVRDSTLNSTNDFQIFGETFEEVAFIGPKSYAVTTPICNDGTVAVPATAITCSAS